MAAPPVPGLSGAAEPSGLSGLPAYADHVSSVETAAPRRARWPFAALAVLGLLLVLVPIVTAMFPRAVRGEAMIEAFEPYVTSANLQGYRDDLGVLDDARANVLALRAEGLEPGRYDRVEAFVRDYPGIEAELTRMIDAIDDNRANYEKLSATAPFGALPWLLALPGSALVLAGVLGFRRASAGKSAPAWYSVAALAGAALVAVPLAGGLFAAAPTARPLLDGFGPILTHEQVRTAQGYFVTLVAANGELDARYTADVRTAHPGADLTGLARLEQRWQPMTSRFAALIGVMNDNVANFDAVVALDETTKPLGFTAFRALGWFYLVPGVLVLAVVAAGATRSRAARSVTTGGAGR